MEPIANTQTTIGLVGTGNMGSALVRGWLRDRQRPGGPADGEGTADPAKGGGQAGGSAGVGSKAQRAAVAPVLPELRFVVWDKVEAAAWPLLDLGPVHLAASLDDLAEHADIILVVVKPKDAAEVLGALARVVRSSQVVVSSMAGIPLEWMRGVLGPGPALVRIMPNLGVGSGAGAVAFVAERGTPDVVIEEVRALLQPLGLVEAVPEDLFDVVTAVAGSGPAFLALAVESLEDGMVAAGSSRSAARALVRRAASVAGALLPEYCDSPAELREKLGAQGSSHGAAMELLEERRTREAFRQAVAAAVDRSRQMRKS